MLELKKNNEFNVFLVGFVADEKICSRCGKRFLILPDGTIPVPEQCVYHWGRAFKKRSMIILLEFVYFS